MSSWRMTMYKRSPDGILYQAPGISTNAIIDGRLNLDNAKTEAVANTIAQSKHDPNVVGFKLYRADRFLPERILRAQPLYEVKINDRGRTTS